MKSFFFFLWLFLGFFLAFSNTEAQSFISWLFQKYELYLSEKDFILNFLDNHGIGVGWGIISMSLIRGIGMLLSGTLKFLSKPFKSRENKDNQN